MRYILLALVCFMCADRGYGQTPTRSWHTIVVEITKEKKPKRIYSRVEITPAVSDADSLWIQSIETELNQSMPYKNGAKPGKYIVSFSFLKEKDGSVNSFQCIKDPGFGMCKQVLTAIHKEEPGRRWAPVEVTQ